MNGADALTVLSDAIEEQRLDHMEKIVAAIKADAEITVPVLGSESPWDRSPYGSWHGEWVSIDGVHATGFAVFADNILLVLAYGSTEKHDWDGSDAGIVLLTDGRLCAWESWWGPTGSGFRGGAYGDASIGFAKSVHAATQYLSERSRELLVWIGGER